MDSQETTENFTNSESSIRRQDLSTLLFAAGIMLVTGWTAALPLSRFVQQAAFRRFHLLTESFPAWAVQQLVPTMYSFENRIWLDESSISQNEFSEESISCKEVPTLATTEPVKRLTKSSQAINHFPVRLFTFGDHRFRLLGDDCPHRLVVRTRYRGSELLTQYDATPVSPGLYLLTKSTIENGVQSH